MEGTILFEGGPSHATLHEARPTDVQFVRSIQV